MKNVLKILLGTVPVILLGCARPIDPPAAKAKPSEILLYQGSGAWQEEVDSLTKILFDHGYAAETATAERLNSFTREDFARYKLLVISGGYAPTVLKLLSDNTKALIRNAVRVDGLSYLGFCSGAWMAVAPEPWAGLNPKYGLGIVNAPYVTENFLGKQHKEVALDSARFPNGRRRTLLWYGGPVTPNFAGGVVARYSDGTPAISQVFAGRGLVLMSGYHPAVTVPMLDSVDFRNDEAVAPDLTWELLEAGIQQRPLPAFR